MPAFTRRRAKQGYTGVLGFVPDPRFLMRMRLIGIRDVKPSNIFLVGPMGAGKTTVGRRLASSLNMEFVDSDLELESRTGVDISYIFEKEGESGFRRRESQVIDELSARYGIVLATGGGSVISEDNRKHLASRGFVVYLRTSLGQQEARTRRCDNRPLLRGMDRGNVLQRLFAERDPLYREIADLVIDTDRYSARQLVQLIAQAAAAGGDARNAAC